MASKPLETGASKSVLGTVEHTLNVKIPHWPYEKWELAKIETREEDLDMMTEHMPATHSIPAVVGPVFDKFLQCFSHQLDIHNNNTCSEILNQITTLLKDSLEELGKTYNCFENCRLVQAGSVAEKTKIQAPDEFDFLIVLDYFSNKDLFQIVVRKDVLRIYVKDPTVVDLLPFDTSDHSLDFSLRLKFMKLFIEIFDKRLPTGWRRKMKEDTEDNTPCISGIASTLHLVSEKNNLKIDVDLCLCLLIIVNEFEGALFIPEDINTHFIDYFNTQLLLFRYLKNIVEQSPLELFAILGKEDSFENAISTRITAPQLELSCFLPLSPEDGRLNTYCIAKCILSAFLPKLSIIFDCKSCFHKLVRSYHIKNIFFFMLNNYKEDIHWEEDKVPLRVLEMFSILKQCMITDDDSSYDAAISTYSLPGTLYLENVTNISTYYESQGGHTFFFTPDSHKPRYQLGSSPVYEQYLKTGSDEADDLLKEWFEKLNNKPWNSKQLLEDLINLLKRLNEMTCS